MARTGVAKVRFTRTTELGSGTYATVFKGVRVSDRPGHRREYAVKIIRTSAPGKIQQGTATVTHFSESPEKSTLANVIHMSGALAGASSASFYGFVCVCPVDVFAQVCAVQESEERGTEQVVAHAQPQNV